MNILKLVGVFFNGVRREMSIEFESLRSIIFITEKPWRSRQFFIENKEGNDDNLEENVNTNIEEDLSLIHI